MLLHVLTGDSGNALGGCQITRQHFHGGTLSGPVGPQESDHFTLVESESHISAGGENTIKLRQSHRLNHGGTSGSGGSLFFGHEESSLPMAGTEPRA